MRRLRGVMAAVGLGLFAQSALAAIDAPAGHYVLESNHGYITFSYSHLGFSTPHVGFTDFEVDLIFNPAAPEQSRLLVTIDADSVSSRVDEFDEHLAGEQFFDTTNYPTITFRSTKIVLGDANTAVITGDLTIKEQTQRVRLDAVLNKAGIHPMLEKPVMGFNAQASLERSDWGMDYAIPMVGDDINLYVSVELQLEELQAVP